MRCIVLIANRGGRRPAWIMLLKYKEAISATLAKRERELEAAPAGRGGWRWWKGVMKVVAAMEVEREAAAEVAVPAVAVPAVAVAEAILRGHRRLRTER